MCCIASLVVWCYYELAVIAHSYCICKKRTAVNLSAAAPVNRNVPEKCQKKKMFILECIRLSFDLHENAND